MTTKIDAIREYLEQYFEDNTMDDFLTDLARHPADFVMDMYEAGALDDYDILKVIQQDDDEMFMEAE